MLWSIVSLAYPWADERGNSSRLWGLHVARGVLKGSRLKVPSRMMGEGGPACALDNLLAPDDGVLRAETAWRCALSVQRASGGALFWCTSRWQLRQQRTASLLSLFMSSSRTTASKLIDVSII